MQHSSAEVTIKSKDMTSWPCPSFWNGVKAADSGSSFKVANEMTPNCRDGDPYVRCTVDKD